MVEYLSVQMVGWLFGQCLFDGQEEILSSALAKS